MKQNRRVWTILAVCLLLVCTLALSALAQGGATEKTVYVGTYSGTDSDGTLDKPYTSLNAAIEAINAAKAATCTEEGVVEHYTCSVCKKNFSDAEGKTALSATVIPSCHSVEKVEGKAATTTENGLKEHYGCASCGKVYADAEGKTEVTKDSLIISATSAPTDTGDDFQAWPFVLLMLLSVAGVTVLVIGKKQWFRKNK